METRLQTKEEIVEEQVKDPYRYTAIYARESNSNAPNALETQIFTCRNYALNKGLLIYDVYKELISASQVPYQRRKEFMRLVEDARKGYFKKIIITRRDRLTRRFEEFIELKNLFKKLDVEIIYSNDIQVNEGKDYACGFIENIIVALAEMEPRRIKARSEAGRRIKAHRGIYDKNPCYGLYYDKHEKQYYRDGVKAEIVKDIFDIYVNYKRVRTPQHIVEELYKKAKTRDDDLHTYEDLVKKLSNTTIKDILSRPVYAGIQTRDIDYKYKDFYIKYNGETKKVDQAYFHKYENIKTIIPSEQWYKAVEKWYVNNPQKKKPDKRQKREKVIFKDLFICTKCGKKIKYSKNKFSCGTKGCRGFSKDVLIPKIINDLVEWLVWRDRVDDVIKDVVKKLNKEMVKQQKKLVTNINEQGALVKKYISDPSNDELKTHIIEMTKKQMAIKQEINEFNKKIYFLNNKLKKTIIPLIKSDYLHMITEELEKNQPALLELFMYENIKELKLNGREIRINHREN